MFSSSTYIPENPCGWNECREDIETVGIVPHVDVKGRRIYFCSEEHKELWLEQNQHQYSMYRVLEETVDV